MGSQVARAVRECGGQKLYPDALELLHSGDSEDLVLRVVHAPIEDSRGARLTDYKVGAELKVAQLSTLHGLEPLGFRYHEKIREQWPASYRFQVSKRCWQTRVTPDSYVGSEQVCLLQMASSPDERTLEYAKLDVEDARVAAVYAQRFNLHQSQSIRDAAGPEADMGLATDAPSADDASLEHSGMPTIRVAAPVACEVIHSG